MNKEQIRDSLYDLAKHFAIEINFTDSFDIKDERLIYINGWVTSSELFSLAKKLEELELEQTILVSNNE